MLRENIYDLMSFIVVAREGSFTKAAAKLKISQSALSHAMRNLEERLDMRLLRRTTRSVTATEIGEHIIAIYAPHIEAMELELASLSKLKGRAAGTIRITSPEYAAKMLIWPKLRPLLEQYPDIKVEINIDYSLTDIVAERYDAGVRLGEQLAKDMVAVKISPDVSMAAVASPQYLEKMTIPTTPHELVNHKCINLRLPTHGGFYAWEFEEDGREIRVRVDGQLSFNTIEQALDAAEAGFGIAYATFDEVKERIKAGRLIHILSKFSPPFPGYYLYYPSRRQHTPAFELLINTLRHKNG